MAVPRWQVYRGYWRGLLLRLRGAGVGRKVSLGPRCSFEGTAGLTLGHRCVVEQNVSFKIVTEGANITVGDQVFIGRNSTLDISRSLSIGDRALIAPGCFITDHNHGIASRAKVVDQGIEEASIGIGADAWIGANVCILPGVRIGVGAVIGAGAVVAKHIPDYCVAVGVPAKVIRERD